MPVAIDAAATPQQLRAGSALATLLIVFAAGAALLRDTPGPHSLPFIPITATSWSLADLLTSFLLLAQFYINGRARFGVLAFAYALNGLLTWVFIATFPALFRAGEPSVAFEQMPGYVWYVWHCTFAALVIVSTVSTAPLERIPSRPKNRGLTLLLAAAPIASTLAVTALLYALAAADALPHLMVHGVYQPAFRLGLLPGLMACNAFACVLLLRSRPFTPLALWLAIAMLAATLDTLLIDLGSARFSYAWYAAKLIYVFTSSVVLGMMLWDVAGMYGRLARVERTDPLTSLQTRYGFEEYLRVLFRNARVRPASLGLLIVSVDSFSRFAETHGSIARDECLQRIAGELLWCAPRQLDLVARYGGEEFVLLFPEMPLVEVRMTAERIRSIVERLRIERGGTDFGRVTVSIGIAYSNDLQKVDAQTFLDAADRALYDAIGRGRNRVVLAAIDARPFEDEPVPLVCVSFGSRVR